VNTFKVAVLISGRGSNLQALIDACKNPSFPAEIAVVVSNVPTARGLAIAADAGIPAMIVDHTYFKGDKPAFENALASICEQHGADLVALAGFMRVLGPVFLNRFKDKVINIHPSLLPAHKGLNVHEAVLAAGDKMSGCSVHVVTAGVDEGQVIAQREIKVKRDDTPQTLASRVLSEEHILYPEVIKKIAQGDVVIRDGGIETKGAIRHHRGLKNHSPETPMAHDHPTTASVADPEAIKRSQDMWHNFVVASTFAGGAIVVTLVLMAVFLV